MPQRPTSTAWRLLRSASGSRRLSQRRHCVPSSNPRGGMSSTATGGPIRSLRSTRLDDERTPAGRTTRDWTGREAVRARLRSTPRRGLALSSPRSWISSDLTAVAAARQRRKATPFQLSEPHPVWPLSHPRLAEGSNHFTSTAKNIGGLTWRYGALHNRGCIRGLKPPVSRRDLAM